MTSGSNLVGALKCEVWGLRAENEALRGAFACGHRTGCLVIFADGEQAHADTLEAVPAVLSRAGGRLATVLHLERLA